MRYIQTPENSPKRAKAWEGNTVRTTSNRTGVVEVATMYKGVVVMRCVAVDGSRFTTDNEHATLIRND